MPGAHGAALAGRRAAQRKPQATILQLEAELDRRESAWAASKQPAEGKRRVPEDACDGVLVT